MSSVTEYICKKYPISAIEYEILDKEFGNLINYEAWQLLKRNSKNNHTNELEDVVQELKISMISAGSYYKRQLYVENCFSVLDKCLDDGFLRQVLKELYNLWLNRKRHGASKQKFGSFHEKLLEQMVNSWVPSKMQPIQNKHLEIDTTFSTYCKHITWNAQKSMGKKITKEKNIRSGLCSLSEYEFLAGVVE